MLRKIYILILIFLLTGARSVYGETAITWEECVRIAKKDNPDLATAAEKIKQAKADKDISLSAMLPQVDSAFSGTRVGTGSMGPDDDYIEEINNVYSYGLTGSQLVFDGFKTASEVSTAQKTIQAQEFDYSVVSSNVRLELRAAFVGLIRAQELISVTEDIAKRREQNLELIRLRYESGREHKGAFLTAEADMAQAEFDIEQAKRSVSLSQRELFKALGRDQREAVEAEGEFELMGRYDIKPDIESIADKTPFLRELMARKDAARYGLQSQQADFLPKVYLDGSAGYAGRTNDDWPARNDEWGVGFSVSLPLLEGGSRVAEVKKARSAWDQTKEEARSGRNSILVTLERTWKDLQDSVTRVSVQKKFLEATGARAKITRVQYETGLASFNDWIIIENNLVLAKKSYLNAQADMLLAEAYWVQAIGGTLRYDEK